MPWEPRNRQEKKRQVKEKKEKRKSPHGARGRGLTWGRRDEFSRLHAAEDVVVVPQLVERAGAALDGYLIAVSCPDGRLDLVVRVGRRERGHDAGFGEDLCVCYRER